MRPTLLALCLAAAATSARAEPAIREMTVAEVAAKRKEKNVFVYDCNPRAVYRKGHVPGARWVDASAVPPESLPPDKGALLIFYCANEH